VTPYQQGVRESLRGLLCRFTDPVTAERMLDVMAAGPAPSPAAGAPRVYLARRTMRALDVRKGDRLLVYPEAVNGSRYPRAYALRGVLASHERIGLAALCGELLELPASERVVP